MGIGGISIWQLAIVLVIVVLVFGTKKFRNLGGDLGSGLKSFRKAMKDDSKTDDEADTVEKSADKDGVIEGEVVSRENHKV